MSDISELKTQFDQLRNQYNTKYFTTTETRCQFTKRTYYHMGDATEQKEFLQTNQKLLDDLVAAVTADEYAEGDKHSLTDLYKDWQEKFKQILKVIELCEP